MTDKAGIERKWNSLLLKLSSYDHGSAFNHARSKIHRGTAEWIFSTSDFQDWYESTDSSVLNISGKSKSLSNRSLHLQLLIQGVLLSWFRQNDTRASVNQPAPTMVEA